jgi:hypothetical protein
MKKIVSKEEYELTADQSATAKYFLTHKRFEFIRGYLSDVQEDIEARILNNTIREVQEEHTVSGILKRVLITPKKEQIDELSGRYKMVNDFMNWIDTKSRSKDEMEEAELQGKVIIEKSKEQ